MPDGNSEMQKRMKTSRKETISEYWLLQNSTSTVEYDIYVELKYIAMILEKAKRTEVL